MKVLVTGADGMLGTHIVRELLDQGYDVSVFLLPGIEAPTLKGLTIDRIYGNVLDAEVVDKAMEGCDAAIHAAALTDVWPNRSEKVCKVNIDGTRNMIDAALKHQLQRFIYIGSGSSFAFGTPEQPGTEEGPFVGHMYQLDYIDSKHAAQDLVLAATKEQGLPALVIAPTFMFGAYDSKPGAGQMILSLYERKLMFSTHGGRNFVYTGDVAVATVNALKKGRVGECYLAGHENLSYVEAFDRISKEVKSEVKIICLPNFLIRMVGELGSMVGNITKKAPLVSAPMAKIACDRQCFSSAKAVKELDMPQTSLETAVQHAFNWFVENGYVRTK